MADPARSRVLDGAKGMLFFAAIGPPVGSLVVSAILLATGETQGQWPSVSAALGILLMGVIFSYPFGAIPAAVTGLIAGFARHELSQTRRCFGVGVLGALLAVLLPSPLLFANGTYALPSNTLFAIVLLGLPSIVGGTVCAVLFRVRSTKSAGRPDVGSRGSWGGGGDTP